MKTFLSKYSSRLAVILLALALCGCPGCPDSDDSVAELSLYILALSPTNQIKQWEGKTPITLADSTTSLHSGFNIVYTGKRDIFGFLSVPELFVVGKENDVKVIDLDSKPQVTRSIPMGGVVDYLGEDQRYVDGISLLAVLRQLDKVAVINISTETVTQTYTLQPESNAIKAIQCGGFNLCILSGGSDPALYVISRDVGAQVAKVVLPQGVSDLAVRGDFKELYVSNLKTNEIYVVELATYSIQQTLSIPSPHALVFWGNRLFVTGLSQFGPGRLSRINPFEDMRIEVTVETGAMPLHLSVDMGLAFTSNNQATFLTQVRTSDMVKLPDIPLGFSPGATVIHVRYVE
jgi:DNA-binding beta-propeller fold protein YncE